MVGSFMVAKLVPKVMPASGVDPLVSREYGRLYLSACKKIEVWPRETMADPHAGRGGYGTQDYYSVFSEL